jgi:hypothetical protein
MSAFGGKADINRSLFAGIAHDFLSKNQSPLNSNWSLLKTLAKLGNQKMPTRDWWRKSATVCCNLASFSALTA